MSVQAVPGGPLSAPTICSHESVSLILLPGQSVLLTPCPTGLCLPCYLPAGMVDAGLRGRELAAPGGMGAGNVCPTTPPLLPRMCNLPCLFIFYFFC